MRASILHSRCPIQNMLRVTPASDLVSSHAVSDDSWPGRPQRRASVGGYPGRPESAGRFEVPPRSRGGDTRPPHAGAEPRKANVGNATHSYGGHSVGCPTRNSWITAVIHAFVIASPTPPSCLPEIEPVRNRRRVGFKMRQATYARVSHRCREAIANSALVAGFLRPLRRTDIQPPGGIRDKGV